MQKKIKVAVESVRWLKVDGCCALCSMLGGTEPAKAVGHGSFNDDRANLALRKMN